MKTFVGWLIAILVVGGGAGAGLYHFYNTTREETYQFKLDQLKRKFQAASPGLELLDADNYRQEIGIHLTHYFTGLGRLAKQYPEFYDIQRKRKEGQSRFAKGRLTDVERMARDERIDITLDLFNRMRSGQYRPLYTAADKGYRFDIYDISPAKVSGEDRVKISFVQWGAFGPVTYKGILGTFKAPQVKGKVKIPQIVGTDQPPDLSFDPQDWVAEFPPGMKIGYYDLPQFPRQAEAIDLSFDFQIGTVGGSQITSHIQFPDIAIADAWKVPEGQAWEGEKRYASDQELKAAGATADQEQQAPTGKAAAHQAHTTIVVH